MKNIFKIIAVFAFIFSFSSCNDETPETPSLDVTPANIDGVWQLSEWNGSPLAEGTYCYVVFHRRERTFEMYQKFDSMYARYITGSFHIENDPYIGFIITGVYDYGNGDWNNEYVVTDFLETGSMVWTTRGDDSDVSKYVRCESVPEEIINEVAVEE